LFFLPCTSPTDAWKVDARINTSEQNSTSFSSFGLTPGVSGMYMLPKILLSASLPDGNKIFQMLLICMFSQLSFEKVVVNVNKWKTCFVEVWKAFCLFLMLK